MLLKTIDFCNCMKINTKVTRIRWGGMVKIIVNADDFGLSSDVNKAIIHAFEKNLISSTTIITNL